MRIVSHTLLIRAERGPSENRTETVGGTQPTPTHRITAPVNERTTRPSTKASDHIFRSSGSQRVRYAVPFGVRNSGTRGAPIKLAKRNAKRNHIARLVDQTYTHTHIQTHTDEQQSLFQRIRHYGHRHKHCGHIFPLVNTNANVDECRRMPAELGPKMHYRHTHIFCSYSKLYICCAK